jgi:two-component system chemotaxis sensor kinase CheA
MAAGADPTQAFREEASDLLAELETALLSLEEAPDDRDLLDTAFRALHTIKGSGAMFGFEAAAGFTHHLENAFDMVRRGVIAPNSALIGVALAARDHIRTLIEAPDQADQALGERLLAQVAALTGEDGGGPALSSANRERAAPSAAMATWRFRFRLALDAMAMGTNPLRLLDEIRELGECTISCLTEGVPPLEEIDPCGCYLAWDVVLTTDQPETAIEDVFIFVRDSMELTIDRVTDLDPRLGEILSQRGDVDPATIEDIAARQPKLGELLVQDGALSEERLHSALAEQKHLRAEGAAAKAASPAATSSIRVPAERLDDLMDQVGELVIAQARLKQLIATSDDLQIKAIAEEIERLANGLRETTMGIRMLPIGSLFGRFRRLVRDLSRDLEKEVHLTTDGEETELDKTVIERLNDPLVHIVRNSLDHGLEPVEERMRAGKPPQGRIHLSARHAGTQVQISIRDDGRGLDRARIRAKAEEQDLIPPGAKLSDAELFQLIFHPGFSTAKSVTSLSGRGVGMDVVKRTIDSLRGTIEVSSIPGQGTDIVLSLPLTLAIIDGLLVRVGRGRFVMPLSAVEECVELPNGDERHNGRNFLNIRDELVPFIRLREMFGTTSPPDPYQKVVIISAGERRIGLVVDQVLGDHQTVIKSLSKLHTDVASFSGATILGDGTVALILDTAHLVASGQSLDQQRSAS